MAVDLLRLKARCQAEAGDRWETVYGAIVAGKAYSDLCCYGLYVHGKHPVLRQLAESRHVYLWATLMERHRQLLLVCPPEHGKTTVMRWHIEQWIGQQTEAAYGMGLPPTTMQKPKVSGSTSSETPKPASSATHQSPGGDQPSTAGQPARSVPNSGTAAGYAGSGSSRDTGLTSTQTVLAPSALLVMNTATQAEKQCMSIAATLESNRKYRQLYPHVKPAPKWGWTKDTLYLERPSDGTAQPDPTLQATGVFGPIQGARVGLCVVDDPTDQQDARSDKILQNQKEWHQGVLDDRVLEKGLKRDICTRWARTDIAQMLMDSDTWTSVVLPALGQLDAEQQPPIWPDAYPEYPWGRELWPEMWPAERLERKRREKMLVEGSLLWNLAYLCNPTDTGGNLFRREWFQYSDIPDEFVGALAA